MLRRLRHFWSGEDRREEDRGEAEHEEMMGRLDVQEAVTREHARRIELLEKEVKIYRAPIRIGNERGHGRTA